MVESWFQYVRAKESTLMFWVLKNVRMPKLRKSLACETKLLSGEKGWTIWFIRWWIVDCNMLEHRKACKCSEFFQSERKLHRLPTILGWNYYGERCMTYLAGTKAILPYRIVFILLIASAAFLKLKVIWTLADIVLCQCTTCGDSKTWKLLCATRKRADYQTIRLQTGNKK